LPGAAFSIWWMMCGSVATRMVVAGLVSANSRIERVEPTWSACSMMCGGHSGCAATGAPGFSALSFSSSVSLNAWWTMQMPGHSSMSRPVRRAT
jgi:hypothetical protein